MPNLTGTTKYFPTNSETYSSTLASSIAALAPTVPVQSSLPYNDNDVVVLTVEPGTANQATFTGTKSGNTFINCVWTEGNTGVGHNGGVTIADYDSATHYGLHSKGMLIGHNNDGTHKPFTESNIVPTPALQDSSVTASKISPSSIKLGKAQITSQITTGSTSNTPATGLSVTVTVPSGGRSVKITFSSSGIGNANGGQACAVNIWDGAVGTGTIINEHSYLSSTGGQTVPDTMVGEHTPTAGTHTYNIGYRASGGTAAIAASSNGPALILVELI